MSEHDLKLAPEFWDALESGRKTFEVRYAGDRDFRVGDTLRLREWDKDAHPLKVPGGAWIIGYTGREMTRRITYVLTGQEWGLRQDYAVLALSVD